MVRLAASQLEFIDHRIQRREHIFGLFGAKDDSRAGDALFLESQFGMQVVVDEQEWVNGVLK